MSEQLRGIYVLTDRKIVAARNNSLSLEQVIELSIIGGASAIQLREKNASKDEITNLGKNLVDLIAGRVPLIVNDYVDIALSIKAQGIHIGQKDLPAKQVKRLIGNSMILGVSVSSVEQAEKAVADGADYLGVGPIFPTVTKPDADPPIYIEGLRKVRSVVPDKIPIVAIGGIKIENASRVMPFADGIAVITEVMSADDPQKNTTQLSMIVNKYRHK